MSGLVIVPTYNEADNVEALLARVRELQPALGILVVDDASPDGTADRVRRRMEVDPGVHLLERPAKLGLGTAYVAGFGWGLERGHDPLIQMDCDFSHPPESLAPLLERSADRDLVVGSRYVPGGSVEEWNRARRAVSRWANRYASRVLGVPIRDMTAGFNAWRADALRRIRYDEVASTGYAFQIETKLRAVRAGLRVAEVPIRFADRRRGASKIPRSQTLRTFLRVLQWRFAPPAVDRGR